MNFNLQILIIVTFVTIIIVNDRGQMASTNDVDHDDLIKQLPGYEEKIKFKQYSGYLKANLAGDQFAYYWLVESQSRPLKDPIILWLQGGPGCSSLVGLFTEHGPFKVSAEDQLQVNDNSWNKVANVLYVDNPSNVGFAYSNSTNHSNYNCDDSLALSNYLALKDFYRKFPQLKQNELYLMGEGYSGILLTTLAILVVKDNTMNLHGIGIGNAYVDQVLSRNVSTLFGFYHGLYGQSTWKSLSMYCCNGQTPSLKSCNFGDEPNELCDRALDEAADYQLEAKLNKHNILNDCIDLNNKTIINNDDNDIDIRYPIECVDHSSLIKYLNRQDVRSALHVNPNVTEWNECTQLAYYKQKYSNVRQQVKNLIQSKNRKINLLFYNGDVNIGDTNFWVSESFVDQMANELKLSIKFDYRAWKVNNQIAGYVKHYENLVFLTIRGAGMFVAADRPRWALDMVTRFIH